MLTLGSQSQEAVVLEGFLEEEVLELALERGEAAFYESCRAGLCVC